MKPEDLLKVIGQYAEEVANLRITLAIRDRMIAELQPKPEAPPKEG